MGIEVGAVVIVVLARAGEVVVSVDIVLGAVKKKAIKKLSIGIIMA